jgi:hypothetical protein
MLHLELQQLRMAAVTVTNLTFSDALATTAGCIVTQVRTFTAIDDCGNSALHQEQ